MHIASISCSFWAGLQAQSPANTSLRTAKFWLGGQAKKKSTPTPSATSLARVLGPTSSPLRLRVVVGIDDSTILVTRMSSRLGPEIFFLAVRLQSAGRVSDLSLLPRGAENGAGPWMASGPRTRNRSLMQWEAQTAHRLHDEHPFMSIPCELRSSDDGRCLILSWA